MAFSENKKKEKNKPFRVAMIGHKRVPSREGGVDLGGRRIIKKVTRR